MIISFANQFYFDPFNLSTMYFFLFVVVLIKLIVIFFMPMVSSSLLLTSKPTRVLHLLTASQPSVSSSTICLFSPPSRPYPWLYYLQKHPLPISWIQPCHLWWSPPRLLDHPFIYPRFTHFTEPSKPLTGSVFHYSLTPFYVCSR